MKTIEKYSLAFLSFMVLNISCSHKDENKHDLILFKNDSDKTIYLKSSVDYPDTMIHFSNPVLAGNSYKVAPNTIGDPLRLTDTYEELFRQIDTLMVFVFDSQTLENVPWETVINNYIILKRYDLSYLDLNTINWTIIYP
jgi:hypothetical protein